MEWKDAILFGTKKRVGILDERNEGFEFEWDCGKPDITGNARRIIVVCRERLKARGAAITTRANFVKKLHACFLLAPEFPTDVHTVSCPPRLGSATGAVAYAGAL